MGILPEIARHPGAIHALTVQIRNLDAAGPRTERVVPYRGAFLGFHGFFEEADLRNVCRHPQRAAEKALWPMSRFAFYKKLTRPSSATAAGNARSTATIAKKLPEPVRQLSAGRFSAAPWLAQVRKLSTLIVEMETLALDTTAARPTLGPACRHQSQMCRASGPALPANSHALSR